MSFVLLNVCIIRNTSDRTKWNIRSIQYSFTLPWLPTRRTFCYFSLLSRCLLSPSLFFVLDHNFEIFTAIAGDWTNDNDNGQQNFMWKCTQRENRVLFISCTPSSAVWHLCKCSFGYLTPLNVETFSVLFTAVFKNVYVFVLFIVFFASHFCGQTHKYFN